MNEGVCYIWLHQAIGICSRISQELLSRFNSVEEVYKCTDFSFLGEKREKYIKRLEEKDASRAYEVYKRCEQIGASITGYYDARYPKRLRDLSDAPVALYSIGEFKDLNRLSSIGVVGTRNMSELGKKNAEEFAYSFAKNGICVVSGLARGIDTAAHRGAVMAGGYTVAVLGTPIGDIYPKENIKAYETLYKRGLVVSEHYPDSPRTRADFPNRNRIISALSDAVVIIEAGEKSGSLITANYAKKQGKPLYALPCSVGENGKGTNMLIKQGAVLVTEPKDVFKPLFASSPEAVKHYEPEATEQLRSYGIKGEEAEASDKSKKCNTPKADKPDLSSSALPYVPLVEEEKAESATALAPVCEEENGNQVQTILALLKGKKPLSADEIAIKTGIPVSEVLATLTIMEIEGEVISSAGGRFISSRF